MGQSQEFTQTEFSKSHLILGNNFLGFGGYLLLISEVHIQLLLALHVALKYIWGSINTVSHSVLVCQD